MRVFSFQLFFCDFNFNYETKCSTDFAILSMCIFHGVKNNNVDILDARFTDLNYSYGDFFILVLKFNYKSLQKSRLILYEVSERADSLCHDHFSFCFWLY